MATLTKDLAKARTGPTVSGRTASAPGPPRPRSSPPCGRDFADERGWPVEEALERVMTEDWGMNVALGRAGRPEELGDVIAFLLSERASYLTGATINVDGGTNF